MEKNYYEYREIIMGLREEYLKARRQLDELKQFVEINDSKVDDIYFSCGAHTINEEDISRMMLVFRENTKGKIYRFLNGARRIHGFNWGWLRNKEGKYEIGGSYKASISNQEEFAKKIEEINANDFFNNIFKNEFISLDDTFKLMIMSSRIYLFNNEETEDYYNGTVLDYRGVYDIFNLGVSSKSRYKSIYRLSDAEYIEELLKFKIPKELLNEYQRSLIDSSDRVNQPIIVSEEHPLTKDAKYSIKDDGQKLVLTRK